MRFRNPIPLSFTQEHYMELSDSDDENDENQMKKSKANRLNSVNALTTSQKNKIKKGPTAGAGVKIQFKRDSVVNRERPVSAALFRSLADIDPEFKVREYIVLDFDHISKLCFFYLYLLL